MRNRNRFDGLLFISTTLTPQAFHALKLFQAMASRNAGKHLSIGRSLSMMLMSHPSYTRLRQPDSEGDTQ